MTAVMNLLWGVGCNPLVRFGLTLQVWLMVMAGFLIGALFQAGMVIWGTLLQRRLPADEIANPLDGLDDGSAELAALQERPD